LRRSNFCLTVAVIFLIAFIVFGLRQHIAQEERANELQAIAASMKANAFTCDPPRFGREELHEWLIKFMMALKSHMGFLLEKPSR
jgi:hypothetical protein